MANTNLGKAANSLLTAAEVNQLLAADGSGNWAVGIASGDGFFHIHHASAGTVTANASSDELVIENSDTGGISILVPDDKNGQIYFGTPSDNSGAIIRWAHDADLLSIGTDNAGAQIAFLTAGFVEAMRIDENQNVGIGITTTPDGPLHVHKATAGTITANANSVLVLENSTSMYLNFLSPNTAFAGIAWSDPEQDADAAITYSHVTGDMSFSARSTSIMMLDGDNGRVGIGTAAPGFDLSLSKEEVGTVVALQVANTDNSNTASGARLLVTVGGASAGDARIDLGVTGVAVYSMLVDNDDSDKLLWNFNDVTKMAMTSAGNVGIGTASPGAANILDIVKDQNAATTLHIDNSTSGGSALSRILIEAEAGALYIDVKSSGYTTSGIHIADAAQIMADAQLSGGLQIAVNHATADMSFWTNATQRVTIDGATGNVGIGQAGPTHLLELNANDAWKPTDADWDFASDARLKENIELADLDICYNLVKNLPLKRYGYRKDSYSDEQIKDRNVIGWLADDVLLSMPKSVSISPFTKANEEVIEDCMSINVSQVRFAQYGALQKTIMIVEEQQSDLEAANARIKTLEAKVKKLEAA